MNPIRFVIEQPVTVAVGVILILLAGLVALDRIPIQLTPNIEDTVISVRTTWEGASPEEIEREIIERQEEKLHGLTNLREMTSQSQQGQGSIRLEFATGTPKEHALREVSDKLREVSRYPAGVDEPVVSASDPTNRDFIAWIVLWSDDPDFDVRTQRDFAEDRIKPLLDRVEGVSEINVLGGYERETQIRFDPLRLAQFGITAREFIAAIQRTNRNVSAGELLDAKHNVRIRTVSQYETVEDVESTVITQTEAGPVMVRDVAEVVETFKRARSFVRSKGRRVISINAQREVDANVMRVMADLRAEIERLNAPGGQLDVRAQQLGLNGTLRLDQVFDQTVYIDDAITLVRNNIFLGGTIAVLVLLLFLRSLRSVGIIAVAIPISVIGAVVAMVAMGRSVNVISLAGMAFAVGMVVDNAIVVLENIFRHLEMGKPPRRAAYDGAREVWGAVLASTLTTIAVFVPILLVQEEAGQLFRDIALAICAAVGLSLLVSISVIPTAAARILRSRQPRVPRRGRAANGPRGFSAMMGRFIYLMCGSWIARLTVVALLTTVSIAGTILLKPPADYLPQGNRNLSFGMMVPPPGYNLHKMNELADRVEPTIRPFWEAGAFEPGTPEHEQAMANLPSIPTFDWAAGAPGPPITPPPIDNYFFVMFGDTMFHGAVSKDPRRVVDMVALLNHATRKEVLPDVNAFAFQVPLFRLGGSTGSAVKINFVGDDLNRIARATEAVYRELGSRFGFQNVQSDPGNFNIDRPELRISPDRKRLADVGMTPEDLALAVQAAGEGAIVGEYRVAGDAIDLRIISIHSVDQRMIVDLEDTPIATGSGEVVPLKSVATFDRVSSPPQINRTGRQRSVTLQFTAPQGLALEQAIEEIDLLLAESRASGAIPNDVVVTYTGSASKLRAVEDSLLGDRTFLGTLNSSLALALIVVYLMLCTLFQSFIKPIVIMFSVPLATLGGFLALAAVHRWSEIDRYLPVQNLDVLTMLGFLILIGVVVNNAILLVHQTRNFMHGRGDAGIDAAGIEGASAALPARRAIAEAVRTRVRPILMSTFTSVGGMLPLVLMPGSGSELYRGLGSVVVGGLLVSAIFTLVLVPMLLSMVLDVAHALSSRRAAPSHETRPVGELPVGVGAAGATQRRR